MPVLSSETERFALSSGTYTIGGHGPDAVPMSSLGRCPAVAALVVPPYGPATIQRLAAGVVVRLNSVPLGIAPKELHDAAEIEFQTSRLTFTTDGDERATIAASGIDAVTVEHFAGVPGRKPDVSEEHEMGDGHRSSEPARVKARMVNGRTGDVVALSGQRIVVGRDPACDLVLLGMGVSRRHFSVTPVRGGYLLRDESVNGTLVNGKPVSGGYLLGHGDVVRLDKEELRFELDGAAAPARTGEGVPTQILDLSRLRGDLETDASRERGPLEASLEVIGGPYAGASFPVERAVCSIGRSAQADVRLPDHSVSINHATLLRKGASWFVVDLRSANGTFVDGSRVAGERELTSGAHLKLGSVELAFRALNSGIEVATEQPRKRWGLLQLLRPFRRAPAVAAHE